MLSENIKGLRKAKGLSQEELAIRLNVVRQTVSKWEKGLSTPDSEMLIKLAEELDTTVSVLLGETVAETSPTEIQILSAKLELLNEQFAKRNEKRRKAWRAVFIIVGVLALLSLVFYLFVYGSLLSAMNGSNSSVGIIGGADGPTMILVARQTLGSKRALLALAVAVAAGIGIYKTRKK